MRVCVPQRSTQLTCFVCDSAFPTSTAATAATSADDVLNESDEFFDEEYGEEDDGSTIKNTADAASGQVVEGTSECQH